MYRLLILMTVLVLALSARLHAHDATGKYYYLNSSEIISAFAGHTLHSVNARTKANIRTFLSRGGTIKQSIETSNVQRTGKWHAVDNQLCLRWQHSDDEYCFDHVMYHDNTFFLSKNDVIETTVIHIEQGDQTGF